MPPQPIQYGLLDKSMLFENTKELKDMSKIVTISTDSGDTTDIDIDRIKSIKTNFDFSSITTDFNDYFSKLAKSLAESLENHKQQVIESSKPYIETEWVYLWDMKDLTNEISNIYADKNSGWHNAIDQLIIDFYMIDEYRRFWQVINDVIDHPLVGDFWKTVIYDAAKAHVQGQYSLTSPAIMPILDYLIKWEFASPHYGEGKDIQYKKIKSRLKSDIDPVDGMHHSLHTYTLFSLMIKVFEKTKPQEVISNPHSFSANRHTIAHGLPVNYAYSKFSLRTFLTIKAILDLIDEYKEAEEILSDI